MIPKPSKSVGNARPPFGRRLCFKKKINGEERKESSASKGDEARVILKCAKGTLSRRCDRPTITRCCTKEHCLKRI
eukprot:842572-Ditylum_brightwellii.AAC.1